jgi:glycogen(starch) synthase
MTVRAASVTAERALRPILITETYPPDSGGMAQSCDRIVRGLRARGVAVDVVHVSARYAGLQLERQQGGNLLRAEAREDLPHALNLLWQVLSREAVGCTHVMAFGGNVPLSCAPVFAAWLGLPLVTMLRGNDFDVGIFCPRRGPTLREALTRSAAVCVVTSDHQRRVARLFPSLQVSLVANGIDAEAFALLDMDHARAAAFRAAHVGTSRRVIGLFGHLKHKKGAAVFLDALCASPQRSRAHLLIVGELEPQLAERLQQLQDEVEWTQQPFMDRFELLPWYAACDLVALPSHYDGLPNVLLEAAAVGVPVLASRAAGMADVLEGESATFMFEPGDVDGCGRALDLALAAAPGELRRIGRALQARVLEHYTVQAEAACYQQLLLQISQR